MTAGLVGIIVLVVQVITGIASALAAKKAAEDRPDILFEIGKGTLKFDKSDILAIGFALFVFWAVRNADLAVQDALTAFTTVLVGSGVKELIQAWYPTT